MTFQWATSTRRVKARLQCGKAWLRKYVHHHVQRVQESKQHYVHIWDDEKQQYTVVAVVVNVAVGVVVAVAAVTRQSPEATNTARRRSPTRADGHVITFALLRNLLLRLPCCAR